jgi:TolA-binding protein
MRRMILACSVLLTLSTGATAGQIYKWVDAQGNVHFGSQPPEGQEAATVNPNISQPKADPRPQSIEPDTSGDDKQKAIDQKVKQDVTEQEAELKKYCETVRRNLAQLRNNPRVQMEEKGEVRRLTEEERQAQITESQKAIADRCD